MIINVFGYGSTGASAFVDFLKEFDGVQYYKNSMEFRVFSQPDGIIDLVQGIESGDRLLMHVALARFYKNIKNTRNARISNAMNNKFSEMTYDFFNTICNVKWKGSSGYDPVDLQSFYAKPCFYYINILINGILRHINPQYHFPKSSVRYASSLSHEELVQTIKKYFHTLLASSGFELGKPIILEQAFSSNFDCTKFFDDVYSLIIDRDPRDVYAITNYVFPELNRYMPHEKDVKQFVEYYKAIHSKRIESSKMIYLNYEDLIFKYDECEEIVVKLLGGIRHTGKMKFFKPSYSINNTNIFKRFLSTKEIEYIERELCEYLYDFNNAIFQFDVVHTQPFEHQESIE